TTELGRLRTARFGERTAQREALAGEITRARLHGMPLRDAAMKNGFGVNDLRSALRGFSAADDVWRTVHADLRYEPYVRRQHAEVRRQSAMEGRRIPRGLVYAGVAGLRNEARESLERFRPETYGQAGRLEGVTPADLTLLTVHVSKSKNGR
ncbi:MAG: hypothetical protein K8E66_11050, partial [Phycisphaerales bacterium]|nr:hypothetical protein [Phycisphaerales bacterium]